jgi:lysophospholipid acyltransferase (LPLAT)-like uncharacterized protein
MKLIATSWLIKIALSAWFLLIRKRIKMPPETDALISAHGSFILAGFHNQILALTVHVSKYLQKKRGLRVTPLVSLSKDGDLTYQTFLRFDMHSVRGSTSKGGAAGLRAVLKAVKEGGVPIFTPDGPRGPVHEVQPGVTQTAAMMGVPIVAFHSAFDRVHEFPRSWDKHVFPRLFARQTIVYSEPLIISKQEDTEAARARLEKRMRELVREAEGAYGRTISF